MGRFDKTARMTWERKRVEVGSVGEWERVLYQARRVCTIGKFAENKVG